MTNVVVTITGPSGSGKTTLERQLEAKGFGKAISTTTRDMRPGETTGVDYHFVSHEEFASLHDSGHFVESVKFGKDFYAVAAHELEKHFINDKPVVLVCEPNGMKQIKEFCRKMGWRHLQLFVTNDHEILIERYLNRLDGNFFGNLPYHAKRIADIGDEMRWEGMNLYDEVFHCFNESTEAAIISWIVDRTSRLQGKVPAPGPSTWRFEQEFSFIA